PGRGGPAARAGDARRRPAVRRGRRAPDADDRRDGVPGRGPAAGRDRRPPGPADRRIGHAVHHARPPVLEPGGVGAGGHDRRRPAGRPADRRPPAPRRGAPAAGPRLGADPALAPTRPGAGRRGRRRRRRWPRRGLVGRALAQEALDLLDERPGGALVVVGVVALLELRHVVGGLVVLLDELGHLALVGGG